MILAGGTSEAEMIRREFLRDAATLAGLGIWAQIAFMESIGKRVKIGARLVEDLDTVCRRLYEHWHELEPLPLLRYAEGLASIVGSLVPQAPPLHQRQLQQVASRAAAMAGLAYRFVGNDYKAANSFIAADIWALEAGDDNLRALALTWNADIDSAVQRGKALQSPAKVRELLDKAERLLDVGAPIALVAQVLLRQAEEHAVAGEMDAALTYVERVAAAWARGHAPSRDLYGLTWPETLNRAFVGNIYLLGGRPSEAVPILEQVIDEYPRELESDRIAASTDMASAYARLGELEHACSLLTDAWPRARAAGLVDRQLRIRGVRERDLAFHAWEPAVRRLDEAMIAT